HDVSDGGLAVALAECAMKSGLGAVVELDSTVRPSSLLFGEPTGRAVVTFAPKAEAAVRAVADQSAVSIAVIGRVGGERLKIAAGGRSLIDEPVAPLRELWSTAFARAIDAAEVL